MALKYLAGERIIGTNIDRVGTASDTLGDVGGGHFGSAQHPKDVEITRGVVKTTDGNYTVLTFNGSGTFTPTASYNIEYLIVAGGGGGAGSKSDGAGMGGGGAGGYLANASYGVTAQAYTITTGKGGNAAIYNGDGVNESGNQHYSAGYNGYNSIINPASGLAITAIGGGRGGGGSTEHLLAGDGGSGGGGGYNDSHLGGDGTSGQGYDGATQDTSTSSPFSATGGGGSSAVGQDSESNSLGGDGGAGTSNDITGTATIYAAGGGGGGGIGQSYGGRGGSLGIGGNGASQIQVWNETARYSAEDGLINTGSGGGGGAGCNGGSGADGVVILRFLTSSETSPAYTQEPKFGTGCIEVNDIVDAGSCCVRNRTQMLPTGTSDYTISFWLKFKDKTESCDLIRDVDGSPDFVLAYDTTAGIRLTSGTTSTITIPNTASGDLSNNVWYNVVCRNNGGTVYLYLNYNAQTSGSGTASSIGAIQDWALFGQLSTTATLRGQIDDFCIWHKSVSDTARQNLYNSGTGRVATDTGIASDIISGMKLYYDCNSIGHPLYKEQLDNDTLEYFSDVGKVRQRFTSHGTASSTPFGMTITKIGINMKKENSSALPLGDPTVTIETASGAYHEQGNTLEYRLGETGARYDDQSTTSHNITKENITTTASWFYVYGHIDAGIFVDNSYIRVNWGVSNGSNASPNLIVLHSGSSAIGDQNFDYYIASWNSRNGDMAYRVYTTGVENQTPAIIGAVGTDLSNGTIFEETDTGTHYMFDGTDTWNEIT